MTETTDSKATPQADITGMTLVFESENKARAFDAAGKGVVPWEAREVWEVWAFKVEGVDCLAIWQRMGHWCGYVRVPQGHPWHGMDYDEPVVYGLDVHGGVTFAGRMKGHDGWWVGFDCGHFDDYVYPKRGGNTGYVLALTPRADRGKDFIVSECVRLAGQLKAAGARH